MEYIISYTGKCSNGEPLFNIEHKEGIIDGSPVNYPASYLTSKELITALFNMSGGNILKMRFQIKDLPLDFFKGKDNQQDDI